MTPSLLPSLFSRFSSEAKLLYKVSKTGLEQGSDNYRRPVWMASLLHLASLIQILPSWFIGLISIYLIFAKFIRGRTNKEKSSQKWILRIGNISIFLLIATAISSGTHGNYLEKTSFFVAYALIVFLSKPLTRLRGYACLYCVLIIIALLMARASNILYLLILNLDAIVIFYIFTYLIRKKSDSNKDNRIANETLKTLVLILPISIFGYFALPRGGIKGFLGEERGGFTTGFSQKLNPGAIAQLSKSRKVAFIAKIEGAPQAPKDFYWRGEILWHSHGLQWSRSGPSPKLESKIARVSTTKNITKPNTIHQEIYLTPRYRDWAFAIDHPVEVTESETSNAILHRGPGHTYRRLDTNFESYYYKAISKKLSFELPSGWQMKYKEAQTDTVSKEVFLQTPPVSARLKRFVAESLNPIKGSDKKVDALIDYFKSSGFTYTLTPGRMGREIDRFWFETRSGFCEHYAAATALVLRLSGVPSRVVLGFQGASYSPYANSYIVRELNSHAWLEYWQPEKGWVRLDPTLFVAPDRINLGAESWMSRNLSTFAWLYHEALTLQEKVENAFSFLTILGQNFKSALVKFIASFNLSDAWNSISSYIYSLIGVIMGFFLLARIRLDPSVSLLTKNDSIYQQTLNLFSAHKKERSPSKGRIVFFEHQFKAWEKTQKSGAAIKNPDLQAQLKEVAEHASEFIDTYAKNRYGPNTTKKDLQFLKKQKKALEKSILKISKNSSNTL